MQAVRETTAWRDGTTANHTYLLDGDKMVAYIRKGTDTAVYFRNPIRGFSRSGRKFETVTPNPFSAPAPATTLKQVAGSTGSVYYIDTEAGTCTCPGYTFRGQCKHTKELIDA
jgi:hypothetical protein